MDILIIVGIVVIVGGAIGLFIYFQAEKKKIARVNEDAQKESKSLDAAKKEGALARIATKARWTWRKVTSKPRFPSVLNSPKHTIIWE